MMNKDDTDEIVNHHSLLNNGQNPCLNVNYMPLNIFHLILFHKEY